MMNNNIFCPKGMIDEVTFILYYILLMILYIGGGFLLIILAAKNHLNPICYLLPLMLVKILMAFNYKKRLMHISRNIWLSVILGIVLAFDTEALALCGLIKDIQTSTILFFVLLIFMLIILPAILALIPGKEEN